MRFKASPFCELQEIIQQLQRRWYCTSSELGRAKRGYDRRPPTGLTLCLALSHYYIWRNPSQNAAGRFLQGPSDREYLLRYTTARLYFHALRCGESTPIPLCNKNGMIIKEEWTLAGGRMFTVHKVVPRTRLCDSVEDFLTQKRLGGVWCRSERIRLVRACLSPWPAAPRCRRVPSISLHWCIMGF